MNESPLVRISIDSIGLPDSLRLFTQVKLNWIGIDADGYINGYKIGWSTNPSEALDRLNLSPVVNRTDSTFLFSFSGAADTASIHFFVQAVDNKGAVSQSPGYLKIPVKNSRPVISFITDGLVLADTIWSTMSFPITFSDPDGFSNIDSIFFRCNNSAWVGLPKNLTFFSIVPKNPDAPESDVVFYAGENLAGLNKEPTPIPNLSASGLKLDGLNRFYLRIKDLAGSSSIDSTSKSYFFTRKTSDLLLIDAYKGEGAFIGDSLYTGMLKNITSFDRIELISRGGINQPKFWNASFYLMCKLYKKVFWYSDIYRTGIGEIPLLLTTAAPAFIQYLRFDGKLLASAIFPDGNNQLPVDDPIFSLVPIERISPLSAAARLRKNVPVLARQAAYFDLKTTVHLISGLDLFFPRQGADTLYLLPVTSISNYTGPALPIATRAFNPFNGRMNLAFFTVEMTYLSGDRPALQNTFNKILNEDFNW